MKNQVRLFFYTIAMMAVAVSCGKEPSQPTVAVNGVTLSPESLDIEIGGQKVLTATVSPSDATNKNVSFSSSEESVAVVTQDGIVKAKASGKAIVTVTTEDGKYKAHCTVNVLEKVVHVTGIALNKTTLSLQVGDEFPLVPAVTPEDATDKSVTWASDNEAVVTVSSDGVVKALKTGKATVMATTVDQGKTASCSIDVTDGIGAITGEATHVSCRNATISGRLISPQTLSLDLSYGVIYSPSNGMQTEDIIRIEAKSLDSDNIFSVTTNILEPETTYYYRCFMSQSGEITYGEVKSFKTLAVSSMIQTLNATDITPKDAVLNAFLDLTDCKYDRLEYGFEVTPNGGSAHTVKSSNHSEKKFSIKDESLSMNMKYSVIAYVKLDGRTYKGEAKEFTTTSVSITAKALDIMCKTATISGKLAVNPEGTFTKSAALYYSSTASTLEKMKSKGTKETLTLNSDGTYSIVAKMLSINTKYYYCAVAKVADVEVTSSVRSFTTLDYQTPGLVDLGLPSGLKWASFNIGAAAPEEYGDYYQWAGIQDVTSTSIYLDHRPYHTGSDVNFGWTKYIPSDKSSYWLDFGRPDNKTVLDPEDDAAHVKLGGKWRMPTASEFEELVNNCTTEWTTLNGVNGRKFTSKKNGNSIFLPATGNRNLNQIFGSGGYYWSSSLTTDSPCSACALDFESDSVCMSDHDRICGHPVRPVSE